MHIKNHYAEEKLALFLNLAFLLLNRAVWLLHRSESFWLLNHIVAESRSGGSMFAESYCLVVDAWLLNRTIWFLMYHMTKPTSKKM